MSRNVLVVEDEGIVSLELQEQLESMGHRVVGVADTGEAAVELAASTHPDLVLMDIRLKGTMDGAEAAARIRKTSNVPIVFLTAYSSDEILQRAMRSEPYGYLVKPIQEQQLQGALRIVLHKHNQDVVRKQSARRFSSIVRALPHGIILTDQDLKVRYLNARAKELLAVSDTGNVWGQSLFEVLPVEEKEFEGALTAVVQSVLKDQKSEFLGRFHLTTGTDTRHPFSFEASAFNDSSTALQGILLTMSATHVETRRTSSLWAETEEIDHPTALDRLGELRSYLELEIIRLALEEQPRDERTAGVQEGQVQSNKRILELMFGPESLEEMEKITGA